MNQHIHCIINNCHYWSQGNKCAANEILVTSDEFGANQPDRIDATMAKQLTPQPAETCMATCCKTFVLKGSGDANVDRVQKMS
ncbi:DUF1540 domain-containing protein [Desulfoscipio geothermicus]|uniref:DUF1540 domain-containing protein n=1 Tax=Desulfoscipio geothermicus DSM 3669 TaxID=1121426 RepID=A0A1I6E570_9FIRM|nr:DUF1540 domain-containing protein [Desulfoscipio geothermicus]SFR12856.1 protein of unknown function [Desulfoscipio geothermicus DSM 3669]